MGVAKDHVDFSHSIFKRARVLLVSQSQEVKDHFYGLFTRLGFMGMHYTVSLVQAFDMVTKKMSMDMPYQLMIIDLFQWDPAQISRFYNVLRTREEYKKLPLLIIGSKDNFSLDREDDYFLHLPRSARYEDILERAEKFLVKLFPDDLHPVKKIDKEKYSIITLPYEVDNLIIDYVNDIYIDPPEHLQIFNFEKVLEMPESSIKGLFQVIYELNQYNVPVSSINVKPDITSMMSNMGLAQTFKIHKNIDESLKFAGILTKKTNRFSQIDVRILNPFLSSLIQVYKLQFALNLQLGKPEILKSVDTSDMEIAIMIQINSTSFNGTIATVFNLDTFEKLKVLLEGKTGSHDMSKLVPYLNEVSKEVLKGAYGQLKSKYDYKITNSDFRILIGNESIATELQGSMALKTHFKCRIGQFDYLIISRAIVDNVKKIS